MTTSEPLAAHVTTTYHDGVAWLEFDGSRAFDGAFWSQLTAVLREVDTTLAQCVALCGGPSFSVGNSAVWLSRTVGVADRRGHGASALVVAGDAPREAACALDSLPVVTVAVVSGEVIGAGLELACRCDLRLCVGSVTVKLPEGHLGVVPDLAPLELLDSVLGARLVRRLLLTGESRRLEQAICSEFAEYWTATEGEARLRVIELASTFATGPVISALRRPTERHDLATAAAAVNATICTASEFRESVVRLVEASHD